MNIAATYEKITQSIIAELEQGAAPWVKPWKRGGRIGIMPPTPIIVPRHLRTTTKRARPVR